MHGRVICGALLALAVSTAASAQELEGAWGVTWAQGIRVHPDGSVEVTRWGEATLELGRDGDTVTGAWVRAVEGLGTARWVVVGTFREGRLRLSANEGEADSPALRETLSPIESMHWEGTLADGRLSGEMWLVVPEMGSRSLRRPWRAERLPGA